MLSVNNNSQVSSFPFFFISHSLFGIHVFRIPTREERDQKETRGRQQQQKMTDLLKQPRKHESENGY